MSITAPIEALIVITLPYFIAVAATIIYTNKETRKSKSNYNVNNSKGIISYNNND
jgi:hypothetical protein